VKRLCFARFTSALALEERSRLRRDLDLHFGALDEEGELELETGLALGLEAGAGEETCAGLVAALGADAAGLDAGAGAEAGLLDAAPDGFHAAGPGMGKVCGSSLFTSNLANAPLGS